MGADRLCETLNRRNSGVDYTISTHDDDKYGLPDQQHLHPEHGNKRSHSPNTCQLVCDATATAKHSRQQSGDKKNENGHFSMENGKRQKTVCYDFKKGICRRSYCRYPHVMSADQVIFCHDFQNSGCFRSNCRFIHRNIEDEEHYRTFGVFPIPPEQPPNTNNLPPDHQHVANTSSPPQQSSQPNYYPNCNCEATASIQQPASPANFQLNTAAPLTPNIRRRSFGISDNGMECNVSAKRPHLEDNRPLSALATYYNNVQSNENIHQQRRHAFEPNIGQAGTAPVTSASNSIASGPLVSVPPPHLPPPVSAPPVTSVVIGEDVINIFRLYEEHNLLRRRVEINEERLQELRATNTYLLHQNEQLRRQTQCSCTSTIVNPVTLTTAPPQSAATRQVINAVSIAPVRMQATPIVSIASIAQPQTQIIASSTPLAITANTTQGQHIALASTQQAGQILGTPQITLATAPSMGITMNTSQPLAMSNATQPIISYPVMTHSILPH